MLQIQCCLKCRLGRPGNKAGKQCGCWNNTSSTSVALGTRAQSRRHSRQGVARLHLHELLCVYEQPPGGLCMVRPGRALPITDEIHAGFIRRLLFALRVPGVIIHVVLASPCTCTPRLRLCRCLGGAKQEDAKCTVKRRGRPSTLPYRVSTLNPAQPEGAQGVRASGAGTTCA